MTWHWLETLDGSADFDALRSRLLDNAVRLLALAAIPGAVLSLLRAWSIGFQPFMAVQLLVTALLWLMLVLRRRLSFQWRIGLMSGLFFGVAAASVWQLGPVADARIFLVFSTLFLGLLVSARAAWLSVAATVLVLMIIAAHTVANGLDVAIDYPRYVRQPTTWFSTIYTLAVFGGVIAYLAAELLRYLHWSQQSLRQQQVMATHSEKQLQHTVELLEKTSEAARIGTWELERDGRVLTWNAVTRAIHELQDDEVIDLPRSLGFYPEGGSRETIIRVIDEAIEHRQPFDIELPIITAQDNPRWVRLIGLPIVADGRCQRIYGMIQDISELKQAQMLQEQALSDQFQALRLSALQAAMVLDPVIQSGQPEMASKRLTETVAEALNVGLASVWMLCDDGTDLVCLDLFDAQTNRHRQSDRIRRSDYLDYFEALTSRSIIAAHDARNDPATRDLHRALARHDIGAMLDAVINSDKGMIGVVCAEHLGGPRLWSNAEQSFLSSASVLAASVWSQHLRQIAAVELRESERRLRDLIENVPGAAYRCLLDADWTMQYISEAIESVSGYPASAFIDNAELSYASIIIIEDAPMVDAAVMAAVSSHQSWEIEYRIHHRDGGIRWVYEKGHALYSETGEVLSLAGFIHDITETKRAQRLKNEFVSVVSHELRTPLTSITGALGILASGVLAPLPPKVMELLAMARRNSEHLGRLINDLLDMEKLVAGQMQLVLSRQALLPLIEQAIDSNRTYGAERRVRIVRMGEPNPALVNVDGQRLLQVMSNLLSNAIKFSPDDGVVEVSVQRHGEAFVRVTVRDHGPGIPDEFRARIFEKFSQADSSDTRQKGGTGLGLAITRELIERMGGQIGFDSTPGDGACFYFDLPRAG